ncbi:MULTISPECIES: ABC transporter permease [Bacillaceae]|uniref:Peptide/nickel transport system permease protein n=1 Tax=Peribacillus huizhouensis TaxID=1501239 RepID=A0ABR6CP88_9BACI|nr:MULTISPECIES: ABC transporter permease [Bacillaceae]MBA9026843.1 peptide/nickel transport system permease protein [Peribacillus huizhouensis]
MSEKRKWLVNGLLCYLLFLLLATILAPVLTSYDPLSIGLAKTLQPPSAAHLFGTDELGRDVLTRLLYGGRISLTVGAAAMIIAIVIGAGFGVISGFLGGVADRIMMRILDALLSIPSILLMIGIQVFIPSSLLSVVVIIGMTSWMPIARLIRTEIMSLKGETFIQASVVVGASSTQLLTRHLLPQCLPTIIVMSISGVSHAILSEATLSFLGIGIPPHEPSWGNMLMGAQSYLLSGAWWIALFPGLLITCTVLAVTFLGDVLQDRFALPQIKKGGRK